VEIVASQVRLSLCGLRVGGGGGWMSRDAAGAGLTDGQGVLGDVVQRSLGGLPCHPSSSHGWHTHGGFGGGGGGCMGGGAGGGYTGEHFLPRDAMLARYMCHCHVSV